ncbi:unnamed protein product [Trichogramma brassicae]|uniref:Uncharacterized protein n=1 Tax=Trichogramma brassicae TaxID=86971 RepID=A0A6H5I283_9HYME|nr:unnamed protein product [Trichogramma brassicae]
METKEKKIIKTSLGFKMYRNFSDSPRGSRLCRQRPQQLLRAWKPCSDALSNCSREGDKVKYGKSCGADDDRCCGLLEIKLCIEEDSGAKRIGYG